MNVASADPDMLASPTQDSRCTLWHGELEPWMDENYIRQLWHSYGEQVNVKMIRNKMTGGPAGYCFVEFGSPELAQRALQVFNGQPIPGTNIFFRLNWATGGAGLRLDGPEYSLFVGDLGREVNDYLLFSTFQQRYASTKTAKVVVDPVTGNSKGYGFVRFSDENECVRAMLEMNGQYCGSRPMRISNATPKPQRSQGVLGAEHWHSPVMFPNSPSTASSPMTMLPPAIHGSSDPTNAKVFVGGLAAHVTEDELRRYFAPFGEIVYVKIPAGKGCGFVHFSHKAAADAAITSLNGVPIGGSPVRLSWARTAADKQRLLMHSPSNMHGTHVSAPTSRSTSPPSPFNLNPPMAPSLAPVPTGLYYDGAFAPVELTGPSSAPATPTGHTTGRPYAQPQQQQHHVPSHPHPNPVPILSAPPSSLRYSLQRAGSQPVLPTRLSEMSKPDMEMSSSLPETESYVLAKQQLTDRLQETQWRISGYPQQPSPVIT